MNEKEALREVKGYVNKYQPILNLSNWNFNIIIKDNPDLYLQVIFESLEYKQARIEISGKYTDLTKSEREQCVVHELSHIILQPFEDLNAKFIDQLIEFYNVMRVQVNESVTEHYAQAMFALGKKK